MSAQQPTIQDIFCYAKDHNLIDYSHLSFKQIKAVQNICTCRTSSHGFNAETCDVCGYKRIHYNSCRDPNCPMCQAFNREVWVAKQEYYTLNIKYYHVVFTLPDDLNPYILLNQKTGYSVLFEAAAETLNTLAADKKYLGAKIGFTAVLHTWSSTLCFHPHLHVILSGGGYTEDKKWIPKDNFIFPVFILSSLFRGKFLDKFKKSFDYKRLEDISTFNEVIDSCYRKDWLVYTKRPFDNPNAVISYLGRYTHRIAISNARIKSFDNGMVTFSYKDYRDNGKVKNMTVSAGEFVRRFLLHVVPKNFTKIRHFGFLANAGKKERIKSLCGITNTPPKKECVIDKIKILTRMIGHDPRICPVCKSPLNTPLSFPFLE